LLNYSSLKKRIKINEGFSNKPYKDQLGNYTIGYGHLIKKNEKIFFKKKYNHSYFINLFNKDFDIAQKNYNKFFSKHSFSRNVEYLYTEMIFQMGIKNVLKFRKMFNHIKNKNKYLAALEMMDSLWYKQTPKRV